MFPLEDLTDLVDVQLIVNPWQALVLCVLIFAVMIWPSLSARSTAKEIKKTLTTTNGGSTVKDAMNRIEAEQAAQAKRLDDHMEWSAGYVKETTEAFDGLACQLTQHGKHYVEQ